MTLRLLFTLFACNCLSLIGCVHPDDSRTLEAARSRLIEIIGQVEANSQAKQRVIARAMRIRMPSQNQLSTLQYGNLLITGGRAAESEFSYAIDLIDKAALPNLEWKHARASVATRANDIVYAIAVGDISAAVVADVLIPLKRDGKAWKAPIEVTYKDCMSAIDNINRSAKGLASPYYWDWCDVAMHWLDKAGVPK